MALQKDLILGTGITANYWKIDRITITKEEVVIYLSVYLSAQTRLDNKQAVHTDKYILTEPFTIEQLNTSNPYVLGYEYLKTLPEFDGAINV